MESVFTLEQKFLMLQDIGSRGDLAVYDHYNYCRPHQALIKFTAGYMHWINNNNVLREDDRFWSRLPVNVDGSTGSTRN